MSVPFMDRDTHVMSFELSDVVPWGRSLDEYQRMFALTGDDLAKKIVGCGDGPASVNAEVTGKAGNYISVDPIYAFSADQITTRIKATADEVLGQTRLNQQQFKWTEFSSVEDLGHQRRQTMDRFLEDYRSPDATTRYVKGELPDLPFEDAQFDLALSSHLLFLYSSMLGLEFHLRSVKELCRVAGEVRIFPLLDLQGKRSAWLEPVVQSLATHHFQANIVPVNYEFAIGANEMLQITHP